MRRVCMRALRGTDTTSPLIRPTHVVHRISPTRHASAPVSTHAHDSPLDRTTLTTHRDEAKSAATSLYDSDSACPVCHAAHTEAAHTDTCKEVHDPHNGAWLQRQQRLLYPPVRASCAETDLSRRRRYPRAESGEMHSRRVPYARNGTDEPVLAPLGVAKTDSPHPVPHTLVELDYDNNNNNSSSIEQTHAVTSNAENSDTTYPLSSSSYPAQSHNAHPTVAQTDTANPVHIFLNEAERQQEQHNAARNACIPYPDHPDTRVPIFRRIRAHQKTLRVHNSNTSGDATNSSLSSRCEEESATPCFTRRDAGPALPPSAMHPWLTRTPMGPFIVHGDGQQGMTGGTGEVGFEDEPWVERAALGLADGTRERPIRCDAHAHEKDCVTTIRKEMDHVVGTEKDITTTDAVAWRQVAASSVLPSSGDEELGAAAASCTSSRTASASTDGNNNSNNDREEAERLSRASSHAVGATHTHVHATDSLDARAACRHFRGLRHESVLHRRLPQLHGRVEKEMMLRQSVQLTGRGVFATRAIRRGENVMIVQSTARNTGVKGELQRLEEMCVTMVNHARHGGSAARQFLHDWVITGQPSARLESWPAASTQRVMERIGGVEALWELQLHPIHIARMAAIVDLNSFLVESAYAVRKGMAYFAEAGFFNHSCCPNVEYDIIPAHTFAETDYYLDEECAEVRTKHDDTGSNHTHDGNENRDAVVAKGSECMERTECSVNAAMQRNRNDDVMVSTAGDGCVGALSAAPALAPAPSRRSSLSGRSRSSNSGYLAELQRACVQLDESGAPDYLFCARACRDIAAGEEMLISYVPTHWSFDNRQYVLHDRYRFWCKCPRCSPVIDAQLSRIPRLIVGIIIFSIALQVLVFRLRRQQNASVAQRMREEEEQQQDDDDGASNAEGESYTERTAKPRVPPPRRTGLLEMIEQRKRDKMFDWDFAASIHPAMEDWITKPPR